MQYTSNPEGLPNMKTVLSWDDDLSPTEAINAHIKTYAKDTNLISDGYHTFGELYDHRITLFITMLKAAMEIYDGMEIQCYEPEIWRSKAHSDGSVWDGWFILGIFKEPGKQITYHLPLDRWAECNFAKELDKAPDWDGHTAADVLVRLKTLFYDYSNNTSK